MLLPQYAGGMHLLLWPDSLVDVMIAFSTEMLRDLATQHDGLNAGREGADLVRKRGLAFVAGGQIPVRVHTCVASVERAPQDAHAT